MKDDKTTKMIYFGHLKRHESLKRTIMVVYMPGKRGRGRSKRRRMQDVADVLHMGVSKAGHLAYDRYIFQKVARGARFCKGYE